MQSINVAFVNDEQLRLAGILDLPESEPRAYALFAHCFTCSKNLKAATHITRALCESGIAVLRFDFTGLGQSDGDFADTNFSSNVADLLAAARFLESNYRAPTLLLGHSLGGTAVLQAAHSLASVTAVATIGAPAEPSHVTHMFALADEQLKRDGQAEVSLGGRSFTIRQQLIDDLQGHPLPESVAQLRKALLIMHAPLDTTVDIDNASALFVAAKHPKSFVSLDSADHLLSREQDSRYAGGVLAAWASRYLASGSKHGDTPAVLRASAGEVLARTGPGSFRTEIAAGRHALVADEPASVGGSDCGPTPYDLLSAALGACTTMTLQMYAAHKKLPLTSALVKVEHDKVHATDCVDCETTDGKIDEFRRELTLEGDLSDEQRARMLEIADRCPVHRTLHREIKIRTTMR